MDKSGEQVPDRAEGFRLGEQKEWHPPIVVNAAIDSPNAPERGSGVGGKK